MNIQTAIDYLRPAVPKTKSTWADIGAGTGLFSEALDHLLEPGSTIIATDKSPHMLYRLVLKNSRLQIEDHDFTKPFNLPLVDGIIMANALHYAEDPAAVLENVLKILKPGGIFILVEYQTNQARPPWIPYPVPFEKFEQITMSLDLTKPEVMSKVTSNYGHDHIYLAKSFKEK